MDTEGINEGLTVIVIILLVVTPGHGVSIVVTLKETLSPLANDAEVNVELVSPEMAVLFTYH